MYRPWYYIQTMILYINHDNAVGWRGGQVSYIDHDTIYSTMILYIVPWYIYRHVYATSHHHFVAGTACVANNLFF